MNFPNDLFTPSTVFQPVPPWVVLPVGAIRDFDYVRGLPLARWNPPVPGLETVIDKRTGLPQVVPSQEEHVSSPQAESAGQDVISEPELESVNPPYVEAVTPEEEAEYSTWTASPQAGTAQGKETPGEQWNEHKFLNDILEDQQQNEWLTVLPTAVLAGDELFKIQLPPRKVIISDPSSTVSDILF